MKITIITCCRKKGDSRELEQSILANCANRWRVSKDGIHTEKYELSLVEQVGAPSMGAGYNAGVAQLKAGTDIVVFTHTDVSILAGTGVWVAALSRCLWKNTGFVGVAGAQLLPETGVWWQADTKLGAVQHANHGLRYVSAFGSYGAAQVMDGVFLACIPATLNKVGPWPEDLGWHFYDIEMTLRADISGLANQVVCLPLEHGSVGVIGHEWHDARNKFLSRFKRTRGLWERKTNAQ